MIVGDVVTWLGEGEDAGLYVVTKAERGEDLALLTLMRESDGREIEMTKRRFKYLRDHGAIDDPRVGKRSKDTGYQTAHFMPIVGDTIIRRTARGEERYEVRIVLTQYYHLLPEGGSWPREKVVYHRGTVNQWERRGQMTVLRAGQVIARSSAASS